MHSSRRFPPLKSMIVSASSWSVQRMKLSSQLMVLPGKSNLDNCLISMSKEAIWLADEATTKRWEGLAVSVVGVNSRSLAAVAFILALL